MLQTATAWLGDRGVDEPRLDTELLLAHVLGIRRLDLYTDHDRPLLRDELSAFRQLMRRRGEGREPVAYLIGERGFRGLDLKVGPGVLIPRPDTEVLVEIGEAFAKTQEQVTFADVGTGSGCVALALATACPQALGLAIDRSPAALAIATHNVKETGLADRVTLVLGDLLGPCRPSSLDLVLSNPPYVLEAERALMTPEILDHEPQSALFDADGLPLTQRLVQQAFTALRSGGLLAIETGFDKAPLVESFFSEAGFVALRRESDLGDVERVVVGSRP
ncbi:MAG: peptide chain release factor N(5)-glutamine methyltransferase [Planctomycetes bacterium]|nr:peptide chain release factor N(5)-glutamine methyltransferase [Planctomycetota bacterium]